MLYKFVVADTNDDDYLCIAVHFLVLRNSNRSMESTVSRDFLCTRNADVGLLAGKLCQNICIKHEKSKI